MKSKYLPLVGLLAMAVSVNASAAPVVLEWVQTSSGIGSYTIPSFPVDTVVQVSSAPITNGRIVLADESLLSQNINVSANSRFGVAATFTPSILEISGTTLKDFNTFQFDLVTQEVLGSQCSYLVDPSPSTSGGIGKNRWCEASVNLVKDATQANRYYGTVSTANSTNTGSTIGNTSILRSGDSLQPGSIFYIIPGGGSDYPVTIPISGYWQQVFSPTNVPLPSALLLLLTGLGLLGVTRRK